MATEREMMTTRAMQRLVGVGVAMGFALGALAPRAEAQRPTRRQPVVDIRGTVPTPQVVTVRPREMPTYSRQVLVPRFYDHDFWPDIQEGYAIMSNRLTTIDTMALPMDSVGVPDFFRLPSVRAPEPLKARFGTLRRQYTWCAPNWWCPSHRVRVQLPADSAALFEMRLPPMPTVAVPGQAPGANVRPDQLPQVQQRWCSPHWWCPAGGVITTPQPTTPGTTAPADTTRRPPRSAAPADSTRRPSGAGTSSASQRR